VDNWTLLSWSVALMVAVVALFFAVFGLSLRGTRQIAAAPSPMSEPPANGPTPERP